MSSAPDGLDIFEPVPIEDDTESVPVFPGAVYIIRSDQHQLWARGFVGPFEPDELELPIPHEPAEVHVFYAPYSPRGTVRVETEGGFVVEDVEVETVPGWRVTIPADTPFGGDPREEPVVLTGVLVAEPKPDGKDFVPRWYATAGVTWRQLKILEAASCPDVPDPRSLWEYAGIFLDPVRSAGLVLNCRGHFFFVDDVGTGKSKLVEALSVSHTAGRGATEAAMTWNARDQTPGVVLREPGGFIGWDEIDKGDVGEITKFIMDLLNFKVVRKAAGFLNEVPHYCRFLIAGNRIPGFPEGTLHAFMSRLQYIGGVSGDARERIAYDVSQEAVDALRERAAPEFVPVHVAEHVKDEEEFREASNEIYKELASRYRKRIGRALERAILRTTQRFPPESGPSVSDPGELLEALMNAGADVEITDDFVKSCAWGHLHDKLRRFADTLAAFGLERCAEVARGAFSLTEVETEGSDEDDLAVCVEAWRVSLENNYGELCGDEVPLPKVGYEPIWTAEDLDLRWGDLDL